MKNLYLLILLFALPAIGQELELTPRGFESVTFDKPALTDEKLIEAARSWIISVSSDNPYPYDVYDVTANSYKIDAHRQNAFFYRNRGDAVFHRIKYTLAVAIAERTYTVTFSIKEIYTSNRLTEMTIADFFAPDGRLKDDYIDVEPSLEKTVNNIVRSFNSYLQSR
ncbi:MAG TPA: hypothetical protein VFQ50_07440 [Flavobacterium sp.]|jgi:hypothetical protein|nr:hypothetical protein [Flavobacterium sp.]